MARAAIIVHAGKHDGAACSALTRTIIAARAQTFPDFMLHIVIPADDPALLKEAEYHVADPRLIIQCAPKGEDGFVNAAMARVDAEFVGFCPAGIVWHPDKVANHVRHLASDQRIAVSFCRSIAPENLAERICGPSAAPLPRHIGIRDILAAGTSRLEGAAFSRHAALNSIAQERGRWFKTELGSASESEIWALLSNDPVWKCERLGLVLMERQACRADGLDDVCRQAQEWEALRQSLQHAMNRFEAEASLGWAAYLIELSRRAASLGEGALAGRLLKQAVSQVPHAIFLQPGPVAIAAAHRALLGTIGREGMRLAGEAGRLALGQKRVSALPYEKD